MSELTYERANELLSYEADSGVLTWKVARGCMPAGCEAGCVEKRRRTCYRTISVDGKLYKAHRVAWLLHYGDWPVDQIDHINGSGLDNRIDNLRDVSNAENMRNARMSSHNTSGVTGVGWGKTCRKWEVQMKVNDKNKYLGRFDTIEQATAARAAANADTASPHATA